MKSATTIHAPFILRGANHRQALQLAAVEEWEKIYIYVSIVYAFIFIASVYKLT